MSDESDSDKSKEIERSYHALQGRSHYNTKRRK